MKDYKRKTRKRNGIYTADYEKNCSEDCPYNCDECTYHIIQSLGELEDEIEQGKLVKWKHKKECLEEINKLNTQLFEISQKIEQGLLIELPCKVGDTIWEVNIACTKGVYPIENIGLLDIIYLKENKLFGKTVFLTKEEAEAKLAELRGGKYGNLEY